MIILKRQGSPWPATGKVAGYSNGARMLKRRKRVRKVIVMPDSIKLFALS